MTENTNTNSAMLALLNDLRSLKAETDCCLSCVVCQQTRDYWKPECQRMAAEHSMALGVNQNMMQRSARTCA